MAENLRFTPVFYHLPSSTGMNPSGCKQRKSGPKPNAGITLQHTKKAKTPVAQEPIVIGSEQGPPPKTPEVKRVVKT